MVHVSPFSLFIRAAALAALLIVAPLTCPAQAMQVATRRAAAPITLDATIRRDVIDTISAALRRHYVDADTGRLIADRLESRRAAGAFDKITDPNRFAEVLTDELRAINGDKHLMVMYDATSQPGMRVGPEGIRMFGPPPGANPPAGDRPARREPSPDMVAFAHREHFGLKRIDILPGNVGYLDIRGFMEGPETEEAVVSALKYLQFTDAIIFDLRRNGGGSPESVNLIISHFTGSDTLPSLTVSNRSGGEKFTRYTLATVPGPRRTTVPLYVLTSGFTASAGEDFTFVLKNLGRATVVGAPTAGAGHNNAMISSGHGFATSISFTRVTDPRTGAEWERVGVQPNVVVDPSHALEAAHALALKAIGDATTDDRWKRELSLTREVVEAQGAGRPVPKAILNGAPGRYEGGRSVTAQNGQLLYSRREGAPGDELVLLADGTFGIGAARIAFEREGDRVVRLRVIQPNGVSLVYARMK
jgi:retinol-binding protein 3